MLGRLGKLFKAPEDSHRLGRWGESRSVRYLKKQGYRPLTRNYSCSSGEIDAIMIDPDGAIVFIEIKTRSSEDFARAEEAVNFPKREKLYATARHFLKTHNISDRPWRFDVVAVIAGKQKTEIRHIQKAFMV